MAFINVKLGDAQENKPVPEGEKYDLRIVKVEEKKSKKGNDMTVATIKVEDPRFPNAELINFYLLSPNDKTEPATAASFLRNNARFLQLFSVPYTDDGYDTDDLLGATANAVLAQEEDNETQGLMRNKVVLPRMKE